jgi:hypothetical protein
MPDQQRKFCWHGKSQIVYIAVYKVQDLPQQTSLGFAVAAGLSPSVNVKLGWPLCLRQYAEAAERSLPQSQLVVR